MVKNEVGMSNAPTTVRLMKELREIYKSPMYKSGAYTVSEISCLVIFHCVVEIYLLINLANFMVFNNSKMVAG